MIFPCCGHSLLIGTLCSCLLYLKLEKENFRREKLFLNKQKSFRWKNNFFFALFGMKFSQKAFQSVLSWLFCAYNFAQVSQKFFCFHSSWKIIFLTFFSGKFNQKFNKEQHRTVFEKEKLKNEISFSFRIKKKERGEKQQQLFALFRFMLFLRRNFQRSKENAENIFFFSF